MIDNIKKNLLAWLYSWVNVAIYVWGANGQSMTPSLIKSMESDTTHRNNALAMYEERKKKGIEPVIGFDCSGLISRFLQLNGLLNVKSKRNCNHLAKFCEKVYARGEGGAMVPCDLVFRKNATKPYYHVGVYVGTVDGKPDQVIESMGRKYGVVMRDINASGKGYWTHWGRLKILVDGTVDDVTLLRGDKGEDVVRLQTLLLERGYTLPKHGADGDYGAETETAVRSLQEDNELPVTGIADDATWDVLLENPTTPEYPRLALCSGGSVNVRSGPGTEHKAIGTAHKGDILTVTGQENGWCACAVELLAKDKFITGYMSAKYVEFAG